MKYKIEQTEKKNTIKAVNLENNIVMKNYKVR